MGGATHDGNKRKMVFFAGFREGFYHCGRTIGGSIRVQHFGVNWNAPFRRDHLTGGLDLLHNVIPPFEIGIANVGAETNPAGNTVDGAGKHFANADRRYRVDGSAGSRGILDGQNQFGGGAERVAPVWHQNSARMPAGTLDGDTKTRRRCNAGHNSQRDSLSLEPRALLDVQFDESAVISAGQLDSFKISADAGSFANLIERCAFAVFELPRGIGGQSSRKHSAAKAPNPEAGWLFRGEHQQFYGMPGTESAALQGSNRLQASENSDHPVVFPRVRNRIDVRTSADWRQRGIGTGPARERVSNRIVAHGKAGFFAAGLEPRASFQINGRKNNSRNRGRFRIGNQGKGFDLRYQPAPVNFELHPHPPANGCRFKSL